MIVAETLSWCGEDEYGGAFVKAVLTGPEDDFYCHSNLTPSPSRPTASCLSQHFSHITKNSFYPYQSQHLLASLIFLETSIPCCLEESTMPPYRSR